MHKPLVAAMIEGFCGLFFLGFALFWAKSHKIGHKKKFTQPIPNRIFGYGFKKRKGLASLYRA